MVVERLTILQVLPELQGGGVERGTLEVARFLHGQGHHSHVVSAGGRMVAALTESGSVHHHLQVAGKNFRSLWSVIAFRRLLLKIKPDVVHVRSRVPGWVAELAYRTLPAENRPVRVSTFHGFYSVNQYSAVMTRGARIIAVSHTISDHIQSAYGIPESRITVIPRGIDPVVYDPHRIPREEREAQRHVWQVTNPDVPVLLLPGRFTRLKGHSLLLSALAELTDFPWVVVFLGDHAEHPGYAAELLDLAGKLRIRDRLLIQGHTDQMPLAYAAADLVLNTSTTPESFGRTAVEAMAMGRPVVVSGHGGSVETVLHDRTGWHFAPRDKNDLVRMLKTALSEKDRWSGMGINARNHVVAHFTLQTMCADTLAVYADVLE